MANPDHLALVRKGAHAWNRWKQEHPTVHDWLLDDLTHLGAPPGSRHATFGPDLRDADLSGVNLDFADLAAADLHCAQLRDTRFMRSDLHYATLTRVQAQKAVFLGAYMAHTEMEGADLSGASMTGVDIRNGNLRHACLRGTKLDNANLAGANLSGADLRGANLSGANLRNATLSGAQLGGTDFQDARLRGAMLDRCDIEGADFRFAQIIGVDFSGSSLRNCNVYGVAAWDNKVATTQQRDLVIASDDGTSITVDDLELAPFLYLLLDNARLRSILDTISTRTALILGRFSPTRKGVLDRIRTHLAKAGYVPIMFDFAKPANRSYTETITTLARMSRCIIADLTDALVIIQELFMIVPHLPSVAVLPIVAVGHSSNVVLGDLSAYPWVRPTEQYETEREAADIANGFLESLVHPRPG